MNSNGAVAPTGAPRFSEARSLRSAWRLFERQKTRETVSERGPRIGGRAGGDPLLPVPQYTYLMCTVLGDTNG